MARSLGGRWAQAGHAVFFGSRDRDKARSTAEEVGLSTIGGSNEEAAAFGEVLLHSVRIPPRDFLKESDSLDSLDGKTIIDINNHDFPRPARVESLLPALAERVQAAHPGAFVVKAFNTMAMEVFDHEPETLRGYRVSAFLASDHGPSLARVSELAEALGLWPVVMGDLSCAWLLEAQGDFIRTLIFKNSDPMATVNTQSIPPPPGPRFGGRVRGVY